MDRNLFIRIEVAFPVQDKHLKQRVIQDGLIELLNDKSAGIINSNGTYKQLKNAAQPGSLSGQQILLAKYGPESSLAKKRAEILAFFCHINCVKRYFNREILLIQNGSAASYAVRA